MSLWLLNSTKKCSFQLAQKISKVLIFQTRTSIHGSQAIKQLQEKNKKPETINQLQEKNKKPQTIKQLQEKNKKLVTKKAAFIKD